MVFDPTTTSIEQAQWIAEFAQAPSAIVHDGFVRIYFSCRPAPDANGQYTSHCAFLDVDRNDLTRVIRVSDGPIMPLGDLGTFDQFGTYPMSVIRDHEGYRAYYAGWTRCESVPFNTAIGVAKSNDGGESFQKLGPGPVISYSLDEPFVMSGPKIRRYRDQWFLYYIAGRKWILDGDRAEPVYKIRLAVSDDGFNWSKVGKDLIESRIEEDEAQASPDVTFDGERFHMFFCYRHSRDYRGKSGGYRIGYASSDNGVDWVRDDDRAGITISDSGWDSEMVSYPHVLLLDGETYLFYLGNQVGKHGFGVARLEGSL
ncbi:glycosylase [Rhodopirellula sp. MGV]|nr:glycosylase [Rhodopirellula sp. MGV]PNY35849.1 glycosylase [Rhodopirellula baltica]